MVMQEFDSYEFQYLSAYPYEAIILVYKDRKFVGSITFWKDDGRIPDNKSLPEISINYPISRFNDVINILRQEKPLKLFISSENPLLGGIMTSEKEPTGELVG
jgi:hypothetical protein